MPADQRINMPPQRSRPIIATMAFALICVIAAVYFTRQLDIGLYDETAYLQRGEAIDTEGLPTADMAPLYSLWYRFLQIFINDPVQRYFVNYGLLIALLPFSVFLLLRALGTSLIASITTGILILLSTLNILNWPRVSVFALIVLIVGLLLFLRSSVRDRGWAWLFAASAITVFIRPEFVLSLVGIGASWAIDIVQRRRRGDRVEPAPPGVGLLFAALLFTVLGSPFANGRSMVAFGQHYALNRTEADHSELDPWTNWEGITERELGTTSSFTQALSNAPDRVLWHIGQNLGSTVPALVRMYMPAGARPDRVAWLLMTVLFGVLTRRAWSKRKDMPGTGPGITLPAIAICLPAIIAVVLINPRQHYLIFPAVLLLVLLVRKAFPAKADPPMTRWTWMVAAASCLSLLAYSGNRIAPAARPVLATINTLRDIKLSTPMVILDADGGYDAYLPDGTERLTAQDKATGFNAFLEANGVNVIVGSPRLEQDQRFANDPEWQAFTNDGNNGAFESIPVPGTVVRIHVARSDQR